MLSARMKQTIERFDSLRLKVVSCEHRPASSVALTESHVIPTKAYNIYDEPEARAWIVEAGAAIEDIFPPDHIARRAWNSLVAQGEKGLLGPYIERLRGVFNGATNLVKGAYLVNLAASIGADTLIELLDQADYLLIQGYLPAAAGIAGGVLETHLRHLTERAGLATQGHGSISRYNDLIGQSRKMGVEIYSLGDGKSIVGWGGLRNEADHNPLNFKRTDTEVTLMIQGIRDFLNRIP